MRYTVLRGETLEELVTSVTKKLEEGWIPLGGVGIGTIETFNAGFFESSNKSFKLEYLQAMIITDKKVLPDVSIH